MVETIEKKPSLAAQNICCPTCNLSWWFNPPVQCDGSNYFRCIECKAVYSGEMLSALDILAALRSADEWMSCVEGHLRDGKPFKRDREMIRAAITEATGA